MVGDPTIPLNTLQVTANTSGTLQIETVAAYELRTGLTYSGSAEILLTDGASAVYAEVSGVQEIVIAGTSGPDVLAVSGDFSHTKLLPSTITVNLGGGGDTLDLRGRASDERVVANGGDGTDTVLLDIPYSAVTKISAIPNGVAITHGATTDEFTFFENVTFKGVNGPAITVTPDDLLNAPALSSVATSALFVEQGAAITLSSSLAVGDLGNTTLTSATVSITTGLLSGDVLSVNGASTGSNGANTISWNYNPNTGELKFNGSASLAEYQTLLDQVQYSSTSQNPTNFGADSSRTIGWTVSDGGLLDSNSPTITPG